MKASFCYEALVNERDCNSLVTGLFGPLVEAAAVPCVANLDDLFPEEQGAIVAAATHRQNEFAAGRVCARRLLARFGVDAVALPVGPDGAPQWPTGFVGSIAHSGGLCLVAIARRTIAASIGIDIEAARGIAAATWDVMCTPRELAWLRQQRNPVRARLLATALFSAKESTYKSLRFNRTGSFEPRAIEVDWDGEATTFRARVAATATSPLAVVHRGEALSRPITGMLTQRRGWILSGVVVSEPHQLQTCPGSSMRPTRGGTEEG